MMKKVGLSALVIFAFLAYAVHQQAEGQEAANRVIAPTGTSNTSDNSNTSNISNNSNDSNSSNNTPTQTPMTSPSTGQYKDGQYTGQVTDAFYGNVQVKATISGGKITDVVFLDYPRDRSTSREINGQAMPFLKQEAISAQSARVDIVSGATQTSLAFRTSLQSALDQAR